MCSRPVVYLQETGEEDAQGFEQLKANISHGLGPQARFCEQEHDAVPQGAGGAGIRSPRRNWSGSVGIPYSIHVVSNGIRRGALRVSSRSIVLPVIPEVEFTLEKDPHCVLELEKLQTVPG